MQKIFISHKTKNMAMKDILLDVMEYESIKFKNTFENYDHDQNTSNSEICSKIKKGIQDSELFIFLVSLDAIKKDVNQKESSYLKWLNKEAKYAFEEFNKHKKPIIILLSNKTTRADIKQAVSIVSQNKARDDIYILKNKSFMKDPKLHIKTAFKKINR